ncbi:MAG TPA: hypothetical protein VMM82_06280, partial [Spirochaetia bacterium]|nr:hypothetical protein [Spirochaetia bacterium]
MIAVLQRQHVQKRAAFPVRLKTHPGGARWEHGNHWKNTAIPARFVPGHVADASARPRRPLPLRRLARPALLAVAVLAVLVVLAVVFFLPGALQAALPVERPVLPGPPQTDQDVYRMLVPEQAPRPAGQANPVLSGTLRVSLYKAQPGES